MKFRQFATLYVYSIMYVYQLFENFPPCTIIPCCTYIWYLRVPVQKDLISFPKYIKISKILEHFIGFALSKKHRAYFITVCKQISMTVCITFTFALNTKAFDHIYTTAIPTIIITVNVVVHVITKSIINPIYVSSAIQMYRKSYSF